MDVFTRSDVAVFRSRIGIMEIPVLLRESHSLSAQPTSHAVEDGKSMSEHVILAPNAVEMQFEYTNAGDGVTRAAQTLQFLISLREKRMPIVVETYHVRYKNMIIADLSPTHRAPYRGALTYTIRLQQVGNIGVANSVSAYGGRPEDILAKDGTQKTAVALKISGPVAPITSGPLLDKCLATLGTYGTASNQNRKA